MAKKLLINIAPKRCSLYTPLRISINNGRIDGCSTGDLLSYHLGIVPKNCVMNAYCP